MIVELLQYIIDTIVRDPFTQISGFWAMAIILLAMFQKDDYTVKKLMLLSSLFWGTHFYLLGVYSGLAAVIIWVFRLLLSIKYERNINAFLLIILITLITWYFTFDGWISLLPVLTSLNGAYSFFFLEKIKLRISMMANSSIWLMYHIYIGSLSGMANEVLTQIILLATVYRMMHPEGWTHYYTNKIKEILWKTRHPDYDRFIFIHDRIINYRKKAWNHFQQLLHFDLRKFIPKRKSKISEVFSH